MGYRLRMAIWIALLRGVNVGGNHRIKMDVLREICRKLGYGDPRTYLQSGNVLFHSAARSTAKLSADIAGAIEKQAGFRCNVILRTQAELAQTVSQNPFAETPDIEPAKLLVLFLGADPSAEVREKIEALRPDPEQVRLCGREIYIYFPIGMGRSKLNMGSVEKALTKGCTGRNWNTVTNILALAGSMQSDMAE